MMKVRVTNILICVLLFSISNKSIIAQEESTKLIKKTVYLLKEFIFMDTYHAIKISIYSLIIQEQFTMQIIIH